jgi:transposase
LGGDRRSGRIEAVAPLVLEVLGQTRDATIDELRRARGHWFGYGTLRRFLSRHGITRKKRQPTPPSRTAPTC